MTGKNWVFLVAGSKGWENYKHQANVCCFYQIIKAQKPRIPDEQIVVMMYDDIAYNTSNPANGAILSVVDTSNVYLDVPKDYTGKDLTPENFLAALRGHNTTDKKVIKSGGDDNIYIFMSGVGKEGTFEFPEKSLHAADFIGAINNMSDESKFSKMVIYMDSSYSATMLKDLPKDVNVFALASCTKYIETTPTDYDQKRDVFLSDKFASTWLKYLTTADFTREMFHELAKKKQPNYHNPDSIPCPCEFGNTDITNCLLSDFLQK